MFFKKVSLCNISFIIIIFVFIYIFSLSFIDATFFNTTNMQSYKDDFLLQTLSLGAIFVIVTLAYSFFQYIKKSNKKKVLKTQEQIITENEKLKSSLTIDLLTNVANTKYFDERIDEEFKRAIREKQDISLMVVDIDEFRAFVDIYGENEGDECLKLIANILVNHCNRPCDLVARTGIDEFTVLLPNTNDPKTVSKKCVDNVQQMQISHGNSIASNVLTISIGTSTLLATDISQKEELSLRAKDSLERAKKSGRNRVD